MSNHIPALYNYFDWLNKVKYDCCWSKSSCEALQQGETCVNIWNR